MLAKHGCWSLFVISTLVSSLCYGDSIAPRPARASWADVPAATGPYTIRMRVADACDANDMPCQYLFTCTNDGTKSSSWQSSTIYEASGLTPKTTYTFNVQAKDNAGNTNTASYNASATTDDNSTPPVLRLDLNNSANNDDANTQPGFLPFVLASSGAEINGVMIDLSGDITSTKRVDPCGTSAEYQPGGLGGDPNNDPYYYSPRAGERIYRDFIYGTYPSGVTITLWGLGVNQDCNITIWAYDSCSIGDTNRVANWYSNSTYIFDTNFTGGSAGWPRYDNQTSTSYQDLYKYAFKGRATADYLGRIILTNSKGASSPAGQNFAFVNAIKVEPNSSQAFVPTKYAYHPVPVHGTKSAPIDVILEWKKSVYAEKHDVYFGTISNDVNDASRINPLGVLVSQNQAAITYTPPELLDLDMIYYWRIDEVNAAPDYTIFKGEVWAFKTSPYFVVENFNSYANDAALRNVWKDGSTNGTSAEVSVETAIAHDGNSMKYRYKNNLPPYYSETYADIADLGIDDHNWLGIGAQALVLYFYGEPINPLGEQLYVKLTDGDSPQHTATVTYGNTNDVRLKQWNKWSIPLTKFTGVNLTNVARITIGFGDGSPGNAGTVYFDDITLDSSEAVLPDVTGGVNVSTVYQQLEGFGAACGWHEFEIPTMQQPYRDSLYDTAFKELGLDIYRIRNTYQYDDSYMNNTVQIVAAAKERNPSLKILISAWSPQASLKSNGVINGGGNATLAKDATDPNNSPPYYYVYKKYAEWWYDSLVAWDNNGVTADYISIQNEPDFDASYDSCRFNATESSSVAGYNKAFEAVYQQLYSQMGPNMPKMLPPETAGFNNLSTYINNLTDRSHVYGYAHHLYNGGGAYNYPDGYINSMINFRNNYSDKPRMMTEFSKGGTGDVTTFNEAMNLAQLMHNALVFENASAYLYWELFWTPPAGLISYGNTYAITNPVYYAFKQYSAFTDPGWYRVDASTNLGSQGNVRISAFKSPDNQQLSIVIINLASNDVNLTLNLNGFPMDNSAIYRTSETENTAYIGPFYEAGSLMLPARSITTISSATLSISSGTLANCDTVLTTGHRLTSDIYPDCYVNYKDLKIITDYWLNTECDLYGDCEGADFAPANGKVDFFDFARFAEQWLWCNDPEGAGCIHNW